MITEIKEIRRKELHDLIEKTNQEISNVQNNQLNGLLSQRSKLTSPDIVRTFNWFQKNITQRREYSQYIQTGIDNKAKLPSIDEDIAFCENKIADAKQVVGNANRKLVRIQTITSLDELEIDSFEEAQKILKENNLNMTIEHGDRILTDISSNFKDISDFCFIHKTKEFPSNSVILSESELNTKTNTEMLIGETFKSLPVKTWEKTVHGTVNCLNDDLESKYAVFIPFEDLDKSLLISALPNNTFFDSEVSIPDGSYILAPKNELETLAPTQPTMNVIGYDNSGENQQNNLNSALSILMNNLGYLEQEYTSSGWDNTKHLHDYELITQSTLEEECQINLNDIIDKSAKYPLELNRFLPYRYTRYLQENSKIKKAHSFATAIEYLHKNIDEFDVKEEKLKTKTVVRYDNEALRSDPKDKSTERVDDVFGDFIGILKERKTEKIDQYLENIDNKYIPDKENFRDELLKATSRLKNDAPIRDKFFSNVLQRFLHLELEKDSELVKEKQEEIEVMDDLDTRKEEQRKVIKDKIKEIYEENEDELVFDSFPDDEVDLDQELEDEMWLDEELDTGIEVKDEKEKLEDQAIDYIVDNLRKIEQQELEDELEIVIEPKAHDDER